MAKKFEELQGKMSSAGKTESDAEYRRLVKERSDRDANDKAIIDKNARRLNREAADVLKYQDLPD